MKARLLFLKFINVKQRLLKRPKAIVTNGKRRPSAWYKSLENVRLEARIELRVQGLSESDKTLLNAIIEEN